MESAQQPLASINHDDDGNGYPIFEGGVGLAGPAERVILLSLHSIILKRSPKEVPLCPRFFFFFFGPSIQRTDLHFLLIRCVSTFPSQQKNALTWYVLSKLSYINLVISDVLRKMETVKSQFGKLEEDRRGKF